MCGIGSASGLIEPGSDVFLHLVQIVVQDTDFTAIQSLVKKRASLQQTGIAHQRAHFVCQIMQVAGPPFLR